MNNDPISLNYILGILAKWTLITAGFLGAIWLLAILTKPVLGKISDAIGSIGYSGGSDIKSIAGLAMVLIALVAIAKIFKK